MRSKLPDRLEQGRIQQGEFASNPSWGPYGQFFIQGPCGERLCIVASAGDLPESEGWEHVSVSIRRRIPKLDRNELC